MSEDTTQPETAPDRKKRIADMTPEEKRSYNAESKRKSREKQKAERLAREIPEASDCELPESQSKELWAHGQQTLAQVKSEVSHPFSLEDDRIISQTAQVLLANTKSWKQQVHSPYSILFGGIFIDATVSDAILRTHLSPGLLNSPTWSGLYQELLRVAYKLSRQGWFDPGAAEDIDLELAGKFKLPPEPVIPKSEQPEPNPLEKLHGRGSNTPTREQIAYENNPLAQSLPLEARLFLDSGTFGCEPR